MTLISVVFLEICHDVSDFCFAIQITYCGIFFSKWARLQLLLGFLRRLVLGNVWLYSTASNDRIISLISSRHMSQSLACFTLCVSQSSFFWRPICLP